MQLGTTLTIDGNIHNRIGGIMITIDGDWNWYRNNYNGTTELSDLKNVIQIVTKWKLNWCM